MTPVLTVSEHMEIQVVGLKHKVRTYFSLIFFWFVEVLPGC